MVHIVKIGNSQGIRIPKPLVELARLEGKELKLQLVNGGLLISPEHEARPGWKTAIDEIFAADGNEVIDEEWLDLSLSSDEDLQW